MSEVQIPLLGPTEIAGTGETKEERKRRRAREWYLKNGDKLRERQRQYRIKNHETVTAKQRANVAKNRDSVLARNKQWHKENAEWVREYNRQWIVSNRTKHREAKKRWRTKHREKDLAYHKKWREDLRAEVIAAYGGPFCKCCWQYMPLEFLAIDHINNDGAAHRKEIGAAGILHWLKKNGYPPGFQVLCHLCNQVKGVYGSCLHSQMKNPIDLFMETSDP